MYESQINAIVGWMTDVTQMMKIVAEELNKNALKISQVDDFTAVGATGPIRLVLTGPRGFRIDGGRNRDRTCDLCNVTAALSQLSYAP